MTKMFYLATFVLAASLNSMNSFANSDYPAASFQPKVVYQDPEAVVKDTKSTKPAAQTPADAKYPAASFHPKVVYSDESVAAETETHPVIILKGPRTPFDPKYPAASFEPKVIYP